MGEQVGDAFPDCLQGVVLWLQRPERTADRLLAGPGGSEPCLVSSAVRPGTASGRRPGAPAPGAAAPGLALGPGRRRGGRAVSQGGRRDRVASAGKPPTCRAQAQTDRLTSAARRSRAAGPQGHGSHPSQRSPPQWRYKPPGNVRCVAGGRFLQRARHGGRVGSITPWSKATTRPRMFGSSWPTWPPRPASSGTPAWRCIGAESLA